MDSKVDRFQNLLVRMPNLATEFKMHGCVGRCMSVLDCKEVHANHAAISVGWLRAIIDLDSGCINSKWPPYDGRWLLLREIGRFILDFDTQEWINENDRQFKTKR